MTDTMRAVVLDGPGSVDTLEIRDIPIPGIRPGWVLIRVRAFGLNRSELHTRLGLSEGVTFPRVLGIEAVGEIVAAPGGEFPVGQKVAAVLGGMGRVYDGGYAEYTTVPAQIVIPFTSDLPWSTLGAIPEMLQTAHGSLSIGIGIQPGQSLLIRGGTTSVGMMAAILAKCAGVTVYATTRDPAKAAALEAIGVDRVVIDTGHIAREVHQLVPGGVDAVLELVGTTTLRDSLRAARVHGVVCFTGMVSNEWTVPDFYPIDYIPRGVRLTSYAGGASDLPPVLLQSVLDDIAAGVMLVPIDRVYRLDQIAQAHRALEDGTTAGKLVVLT
jgi:NADPH:quinone reductase-like Zn-dependent oxidoreductase